MFIITATHSTTLETLYLLRSGMVFIPILNSGCHYPTKETATEDIGLALALNNDIIDIQVQKIS